MSKLVLDASAILAVLHKEPGSSHVEPHMAGSLVSSVNLAEVGARLSDQGMPMDAVQSVIAALGMQVVAFDETQAIASAALRAKTRKFGLSLGDRACLALAERERLPVMTGDRTWAQLTIGFEIRVFRGG